MSSDNGKEAAVIRFVKGRGAGSNTGSRFDAWDREPDLEWLNSASAEAERENADGVTGPQTCITELRARTIISRNQSPDIGFDQSINPYLGCEHGCVYCYARPTHAYLGLSPGLDFETKIFAKTNAAQLLKAELSRPSYQPSVLALGANTDPYQPVERQLEITRAVLRVLDECNLPVSITTKSASVTRDIDILASMARRGLARVHMSIGTLDPVLARKLEPRANTPSRRLEAIRKLADAGIPTSVFTSPLIPALNDVDMEKVLEAAAQAGARYASYVILRLPLEVRNLFIQWLEQHYPMRARHVMSLVNQLGDGMDYNAQFGTRMRGNGVYADLLAQRFRKATARLKLNVDRSKLDTSRFVRPQKTDDTDETDDKQMTLF